MGNYQSNCDRDLKWRIEYSREKQWKIEYYDSMWICMRGRGYKVTPVKTDRDSNNID